MLEQDRWKLIDFDGAAKLGQHIGHKCSTGYAPPEVAHALLSSGAAAGEEADISVCEILRASPALDIWSLGVILYEMCTNESLFSLNKDNDQSCDLIEIESWTGLSSLHCKKVFGAADICQDQCVLGLIRTSAIDLLTVLLVAEAEHRPQAICRLLTHPFLNIEWPAGKLVAVCTRLRESIGGGDGSRFKNELESFMAPHATDWYLQVEHPPHGSWRYGPQKGYNNPNDGLAPGNKLLVWIRNIKSHFDQSIKKDIFESSEEMEQYIVKAFPWLQIVVAAYVHHLNTKYVLCRQPTLSQGQYNSFCDIVRFATCHWSFGEVHELEPTPAENRVCEQPVSADQLSLPAQADDDNNELVTLLIRPEIQ